MSIEQFFGRADEQAQLAEDSGRWNVWAQAYPQLRGVTSAAALVDVVHDRAQPARANELLLALVRVGSADGGVDERAATWVASLLAPGANRIVRNLTTLGPDVGDIVAGQLWLQVREYRWREKPRAVAKNILMDTRRAVLRDYGASTHRRAALVPIPSPDDISRGDHALERVVFEQQVPDLALLQLLVWATAWKVLRPRDAALLWDLVLVDADLDAVSTKPLSHGGAGSKRAIVAFSDERGIPLRSVRRHRDLAVAALREAGDAFRDDFEAGPAAGAASPRPRPTPSPTTGSAGRPQRLRPVPSLAAADAASSLSTQPPAAPHRTDPKGRH